MFLSGVLVGAVCAIGLLTWVANRRIRRNPRTGPTPAENLAKARHYLEVISTGTSLGQCQKVAHKALRVTE